MNLRSPFVLPCGAVIKNRLAKSAMTECLADAGTNAPNASHAALYAKWRTTTGAGLFITGNIMVDRRYLENPWNVVVEDERHFDSLVAWARSVGEGGDTALWAQISHPGRQCPRSVSSRPVAPSSIAVRPLPIPVSVMATPISLETNQITEIITRFGNTARILKKCGFSGVQIHSAHGYLLSQFLSPLSNRRTDIYGGSIENRSRLLLEVIREVRRSVGPHFPIGVKINSADFQRGGFEENDSFLVVQMLIAERVDLVEISGGTYEQPALLGRLNQKKSERTRAREAYFLEFAEKLRKSFPDLSLMVTGGFRSNNFMNSVIKNRMVDLIGIARPFCTEPDKIGAILKITTADEEESVEQIVLYTPQLHVLPYPSSLDSALELYWHVGQMYRISKGQQPTLKLGYVLPILQTLPALFIHPKRFTPLDWIKLSFFGLFIYLSLVLLLKLIL